MTNTLENTNISNLATEPQDLNLDNLLKTIKNGEEFNNPVVALRGNETAFKKIVGVFQKIENIPENNTCSISGVPFFKNEMFGDNSICIEYRNGKLKLLKLEETSE